DVKQRGSNITSERLRIDFSFPRKMTPEEVKQVEDLVNQKIKDALPMVRKEMPKEEAEKLGAQMEFGVKYGDMVSVYFVGPSTSSGQSKMEEPFSIEFCGGPHVSNTGDLAQLGGKAAKFKIMKEEASSAGVRRIKAVLG
ncbi:MAG TPA: alanine--tRNA ligase, partial [Candidatus Paceibacterota bacterium]